MPAASNIVINNGTAVAKTFSVVSPQNGATAAEFRDVSITVRGHQPVITELVTRATGNASRDKVKVNVILPILRVNGSGVTEVTDYASFRGEFTLPNTMLAAERADILAFAKNLVAHASVASAVNDVLPQY